MAASRNPTLRSAFIELKENEALNKAELQILQDLKLRALLRYARANSEYYRKKLVNIDLDAPEIRKEFGKIELSRKKDLIEYNEHIQVKLGLRRFLSATSGTSGQRLIFLKSEYWDSFHRASIARGYSWHGVYFDDYKLYFWGHSFDFMKLVKTRIQDRLFNRVRLLSIKEKDFVRVVRNRKKIVIIEGYSSVVHQFGLFCLKNNVEFPNLKLVKATSEVIHDSYRTVIRKAFNLPLVSEYGSAESGIISFQCKQGTNHVNMDNVLLEELNGEVVVTNLNSFGFPIIRYSLGDSIVLDRTATCKCGLDTDVIQEIKGRLGYVIYGEIAKYPSLVLYNIFKQLNNKHKLRLNYYAVQKKVGELDIHLKSSEVVDKKTLYTIVREEFIKFEVLDVKLVFKDWVDRSIIEGKFRDFYPLKDVE